MKKRKTTFIILIILAAITLIIIGVLIWLIKSQPITHSFLLDENGEKITQESNNIQKETPKTQTLTPAEKEQQKIDSYQGPSAGISLTAQKWSFVPNTITVKKGEKVIIQATSADVPHGLAIPAFQIRERIEPNTTTTIEFIADKAGEFDFFSHVYSGPEYRQMRGKLIVK